MFARFLQPGRQCLVYAMTVSADSDVAMVLPIPLTRAGGAVSFVNLEGYPDLFAAIERLYPEPLPGEMSAQAASRAPLPVERVGAFEASVVPVVDDFARLDPRFRLDDEVWKRLPQYHDWAFVVFKLKELDAQETKIHPMAFAFDSRANDALFFPTVHVHDGSVHENASFAHDLYFQTTHLDETASASAVQQCLPSAGPVGSLVDVVRAQGLVDSSFSMFRRRFQGELPNGDVWTLGDMKPSASPHVP